MKSHPSITDACLSEVQKMCSDAHLHVSMQSIIHKITMQYLIICEKQGFTQWDTTLRDFNFRRYIQDCIKFCATSSFARDLMVLVSTLADIWDQLLSQKLGHKNPSHVFIIVENDAQYSYSTFFYDNDHPDTRLICIHLRKNTSPYDVLYIVLHEMGHYIGCRNRTTRINLYKQLSLYGLMREVFYKCCESKLANYSTGTLSIKCNDNPNIRADHAEYPVHLRYALQSMFPTLLDILNKHYKVAEACSKAENPLNGQYAKYLFYMKLNMNLAIRETISEVLANKWNPIVSDSLLPGILEGFSKVQTKNDGNSRFIFLDTCALQLSEPTADVFMTTITTTSFKKYLKHILRSAWYFWNEKKQENSNFTDFCQFVSDDIIRTRILAIAAVKKATYNDFSGFRFAFTDNVYDHSVQMVKDINDAANMLGEMYMEVNSQKKRQVQEELSSPELSDAKHLIGINQNIWNPQIRISEYATEIALETFYADFLKALRINHLTHKINAFKSSNRFSYYIRKFFTIIIWGIILHPIKSFKTLFSNKITPENIWVNS